MNSFSCYFIYRAHKIFMNKLTLPFKAGFGAGGPGGPGGPGGAHFGGFSDPFKIFQVS